MADDVPPPLLPPRLCSVDDRPDLVERAAGVGSYSWAPGRPVEWSAGFYRLLGLPPGQALDAAGFLALVHPDDRPRAQAAFEAALAGEMPPLRYRVVRPDGEVRWLRASGEVLRDDGGGVARIVGTVVDETDVRAAMQELERANTVLAESQRAAGVGSYTFELGSRRLEWSDELYRILGVDPGTTVDAALTARLVHPEDRERQLAWGRQVAQGATLPPLLVRMVRPDGEIRHLESRSRRVETDKGPCVVGVSVDVTARVALEEQLRHAAKMDAIGTLAAGVAHDFNNYVMVIGMQLDLVRRRLGVAAEAHLAEAQHAVDQCAILTRQLLAFGRREPVAIRPVEIAAMVAGAATMLARLVGPTIEVRAELAIGRTMIDADASQLESAIVNLGVNARDAMPDGGRLTLGADLVDVDAGDPRLGDDAVPGRYVRLSVADTGQGIAPEHLPRVFEPYFTTKTLGHGTGLGLASVYGSVRQHRGFVTVASTVGRGTTFELFLPARPAMTAAPPRSRGTAPDDAPTGTILVVEDLDPLRATLAESLRELGLLVHTAVDGQAALELLTAHPDVDVVLADLMMPRLGGLELLRELRARGHGASVVVMTGFADRRVIGELEALEPRPPVLLKPIDPADLRRVVTRALARRADR